MLRQWLTHVVATHIAEQALIYNAIILAIFLVIYNVIDFNKHFTSDKPVSRQGKFYFGIMTHTAVGCNDIVPKTDVARVITSIHVILAWVQVFLLFLVNKNQ